MRAISLWQPWAQAVAIGTKRVETRHWQPAKGWLGPLAIHAAKKLSLAELADLTDPDGYYGSQRIWEWALAPIFEKLGEDFYVPKKLRDELPLGAVVAVCDLVAVHESCDFWQPGGFNDARERYLGDFSPGRYGWTLANICPLTSPLPFCGHQSFFEVPDELLAPLLKGGQ